MKVDTGCTFLQSQILADNQQHQLGFRVVALVVAIELGKC